jgi:soluble lytic murein transglycosylase
LRPQDLGGQYGGPAPRRNRFNPRDPETYSLPIKARKAFLTATSLVLLANVAAAQAPGPGESPSYTAPIELVRTPPTAVRQPLSDTDAASLRSALDAAKRGDVNTARSAIVVLNDPVAKKVATWALTDAAGDSMSFFEVDQARRDLAGWPRAGRRQNAAEKLLETSGQSPRQTIDWFGGAEPQTAQGAMALAAAYRATGKTKEAADLIRHFWRDRLFEADVQRAMLTRFGDVLTADDHVRRADIVLYGSQGPACRDMIALLPPDQQQAALARMALRANAGNAMDLVAALPPGLANSPGVAFERAAYYRRKGLTELAKPLLAYFPREIPFNEMADRIWDERHQLTLAALRNGDAAGAYAAASNTGLTSGADAAEAEFYAGWIALTRLKDPKQADVHFAAIEKIGTSPITKGRALYWRGRAAEARGDRDQAQAYYSAAAKHNTTFYGLLAGEKVNGGRLELTSDPQITTADRNRFESRDSVRAARMLYEIGNRDLLRTFVLSLDDVLPTAEEEALLVDLARGYGEQDVSMKVVRTAAQRGFTLPTRGYPVRTPPSAMSAPEPALVLGITRQESGFDPMVRSGAGARGMMQLMPTTAAVVAKREGVSYSAGMLDDPDYNMRLGSSYLGHMVETFSGSYVMAIAAYNAGPGRPAQWSSFCGDPRSSASDPVDFIECIPFSETRNYVMRVMEGMQVYRARLNGGSAPITLTADLKRGGYIYSPAPIQAQAGPLPPIGATMTPIPNP